MNTNRGNAVAWTALIIAILSLILAWAAYNRAGANLEEQIDAAIDEAVADLRIDLENIEQEVREETSEVLDEAAEDVAPEEETAE